MATLASQGAQGTSALMDEAKVKLREESSDSEEMETFGSPNSQYQRMDTAMNRRYSVVRRIFRGRCFTIILWLSIMLNILLILLFYLTSANIQAQNTEIVCASPVANQQNNKTSTTLQPQSELQNKVANAIESNGPSIEQQINTELSNAFGTKRTSTTPSPTYPTPKPVSCTSPSPCPASTVKPCPTAHPNQEKYASETPQYENVFEDLSAVEIKAVYNYLIRQRALQIRPHSMEANSQVHSIELHVPNKTEALHYIDSQGPKPPREARVIVSRPELPVPVMQEFVVGPLPLPTYHHTNPRRWKDSVPYRFSISYGTKEAYMTILKTVLMSQELQRLITESYGTSFVKCTSRCLILLPQKTSSAYTDTSIIVMVAYYAVDFVTINAVDLMFVMKETEKDSRTFKIDSIFYAGRSYESSNDLLKAYRHPDTPKRSMTFPDVRGAETSLPGTMNLRGRTFPARPQAGPVEYEPEGRRYRLTGQRVQYLEWTFNIRMSTASGPQVWDVRWSGERIAYEISLQDLGVIYAGANPFSFYAHLSDSAFGLGNKAYGLVPGVDCPDHATFIPQTIYHPESNGPQTLTNAFCLFEHNTGRPLRRHRSNDQANGKNYGGLMDRVLILRTVIVEFNYDYIFDVEFHQNGAIQLKTYATGYVMSQFYNPSERPFGYRIHENVVGSIHHHIFNFKVDLDIQGRNNRYKTLDFKVDRSSWPWLKAERDNLDQISFIHNLKESERQSILYYNFSAPKYHIVYTEGKNNAFGNPKAYRIGVKGFSKQILPDTSPVLRSRRWSQYQLLATKRKDSEESSSSVFSMFDGDDPVEDIDRHWKDDESIVDQDLVFWLSVGLHHIPHTEDIPNTPTVGTEATISLLPFNYFPECPSVGSYDAVRIEGQGSKVVYHDYGTARDHPGCLPVTSSFRDFISQQSNIFVKK